MELSKLLKTVFMATALVTASAASHALLLEPGTADYDGNDGSGSYGPSNCEPDCINDLFGTSFSKGEELYKNDAVEGSLDGTSSGSFSGSYEMLWNATSDPTGGTLSWLVDTSYIMCGECYVAVKDGNNDPRYYFFDISNAWNGTDDIVFSGFWSDTTGAISHVSIWGNPAVEVPEPGTLGLMGLGLMGFIAFRKRRAS